MSGQMTTWQRCEHFFNNSQNVSKTIRGGDLTIRKLPSFALTDDYRNEWLGEDRIFEEGKGDEDMQLWKKQNSSDAAVILRSR